MGEPAGFIRSPLVEDSKTRFFVITSNVGDNVVKSVEHNVWATQRKNDQKLDEAYQCCQQVILVFSVMKSNAFQGYARMRSHTGRSTSRHDPFRGFGRLFDVEWLRLEDIDFQEVQHLRNPLNENKQLAYSRDGNELPHSVGSQLCRLIDLKVFREDPDSYEPVGLELRPLRSDSPPRSTPMLALSDHSQPPPPPHQLPHSAPMAPPGHYGHPGSPAAAPPPSYHSGYGQPPHPQYAPHGHPAGPPPGYPGAPPTHAPPLGYPGAPPSGYPGAPPPGYPGAPPPGYASSPPGVAPPGAAPPPPGYPGAPPGYYPPWMYGRRRKKRRRRSPSSSSSSESEEQKKPKKKKKKDGAIEKKKKKKRNREEKPDFKNMNYEEYMAWWQKSHGAGTPPPGLPNHAPPARPPPPGWPTPTESWQGARPGMPHAPASSPTVAAVPPAPAASPFEAAAMEGAQQERARSRNGSSDPRQLTQPPLAQTVAPAVAAQAPEQTPEKAPELDQALRQSALPKTSEQTAQPAPGSPGSESSYSAISEQEAAVAALESEVNMLLQQDDEEVETEAPPNPPGGQTTKVAPAPAPAPAPTEPLSIGQKLASFASALPKLKKTLPMPLTAKDSPHIGTPSGDSTSEPKQQKVASTESRAPIKQATTPPTDSRKQPAEKKVQPAELVGFVPPTSPCSSSSEGGKKNVATKPAAQSSSKVAAEAEKQVAAPSSPSSQGSEVDTAWARALSSGLDDASGDSDAEAPGPVLTDAYC